jgi:hypothetical protein
MSWTLPTTLRSLLRLRLRLPRHDRRLELQEVLSPRSRVIELGAEDLDLACHRCAQGLPYLGFMRRSAAGATRAEVLRGLIHPYAGPQQIARNNADVLVLSGGLERHIWSFGAYAHARHVLWTPRCSWSTLVALAGLIKNAALLRIRLAGLGTLQLDLGRRRRFLLVEVVRRSLTHARRYISPTVGHQAFFAGLKAAGVDYALLRWPDELADLPAGQDLDLLVADEDVPRIEQLTERLPGTIPLDVYSVSGLPGTDFHQMAYFPPQHARRILERARWLAGLYRVPCAEDHFLSLAYHALYHKGPSSGLPSSLLGSQASRGARRDYAGSLRACAMAQGCDADLSLEGLDLFLHARGWRPPLDVLSRLSHHNPWVRRRIEPLMKEANREHPGLAVFFIRSVALELGLQAEIVDQLQAEGFTVLAERRLTEPQRRRVQRGVRGGNWGRGPYARSGGEPIVAVVCVDLKPLPPEPFLQNRNPHLANSRLLIKRAIRENLNARLPLAQQCNMLHSSDNTAEALAYLELALPGEAPSFLRAVRALEGAFATALPVVRDLTEMGRRAKVEVILFEGRLAVKKTFRPGLERFLARERFALEQLSPRVPAIPPLLASGDNYVIMPYYRDVLRRNKESRRLLPRLWPLRTVRQALAAVRSCYDQGYSLIDFSTQNVVVDRKAGLKVIDFEFLHCYEQRPPSFEQAYDFTGIPPDFQGDFPYGVLGFDLRWRPFVGLDLHSLLHAPRWRQHALRLGYRFELWARYLRKATREVLAFGKDQLMALARGGSWPWLTNAARRLVS